MRKSKYLIATILSSFFMVSLIGSVSAQEKKELKEVTISASMHCQSCQKKIEREIAFEKGVKKIDVNLEEKTVTIKYNPEKNTDEKLEKAIQNLGYETKIIKKEEKKEADKKKS